MLRNIAAFLLRTAVIIGVGAGFLLLAMVLAIGAPQAKTPSPKPQSWPHIATPSPYGKPHSRPKLNHRLPDESVGWKASAEPSVSANVAIPLTPPPPLRKPKKFRASVSQPKAAAPVETNASSAPDTDAMITSKSSSKHEASRGTPSDHAPPETEHSSSEQAANQLSPQTPLGSLDVAVTGGLGENNSDGNENNAQNSISQPVPANKTAGAQFCDNISNAAADARFAWQKKLLKETEEKVSKRIAELNIRIAEYRKWLARRNDFSRKAQGVIVNIYTKMKPDAAAQQLTILDEEMAAAVITKLSSKAASAVMNEMDPKHAARLTAIISGAMAGPNNTPPPPRGGGT
jgi:flagellar motility protein MotE (MotC chaperone)